MNGQQALERMVAPGTRRPGKFRGGVIQVHITRACDKCCYACTQGSNLGGKTSFITLDQFELALRSLKGYFGVVGVFGGNPALHPHFESLCQIVRDHVPYEQRGIWCNHPITPYNATCMRHTFNPAVSNLNVHLDQNAYDLFRTYWPESRPFGLKEDSRHSPVFVSMVDIGLPEEARWELIARCDINQHWSAMIGVFRGEVRAWFCEVAGAQAMLHQDDPLYPDTGIDLTTEVPLYQENTARWWQLPMIYFTKQVRQHCHDCGVPLRGYGQLAQAPDGPEQTSETHADIFKSKRRRPLQMITDKNFVEELKPGKLPRVIDYLQNSHK